MNPWWSKAQESSESAWLLFDRGHYDGAGDRAFFAMFNAARALLASRGLNASGTRSHAKVHALLRRYFVETGRMEPDLADGFRRADKVRRAADFRPGGTKPESAREMVESMDRFMQRAEREVRR
jgi:uncharacterized protein (UPF0332 family)